MTPATGLAASGSLAGMIEESSSNSTTATMMPSTQPSRNPMLVPLAFGESSMRMAAMIGIGLIAMPRASGRMSPMTLPMRCLLGSEGLGERRPLSAPTLVHRVGEGGDGRAVGGEDPLLLQDAELHHPLARVGAHAAEGELARVWAASHSLSEAKASAPVTSTSVTASMSTTR